MGPSSATETDWSRLLGVGVTFLLVGLIMVMVNRIITARFPFYEFRNFERTNFKVTEM
jgi:hypothetical protein